MCLLIMSLPASQLSIQPVMSSIEVSSTTVHTLIKAKLHLSDFCMIVCPGACAKAVTKVADSAKELSTSASHNN